MANERDLKRLEKEIYSKMRQIKSGTILPKDSGIGKMKEVFKWMSQIEDELLNFVIPSSFTFCINLYALCISKLRCFMFLGSAAIIKPFFYISTHKITIC